MAAAEAGWLGVAFHAAALAYYAYVDHVLTDGMGRVHLAINLDPDDPEILRWRNGIPYYFTFWNLILHQIYFTCCCIDNVSECIPIHGPIKLQRTARTLRRIMLSSILFPSAMLVVVNFWAMALYDPSMMFVQYLYSGPAWVNHACHTFVLPIVLLEMYLRATTEEPWGKGTHKTLLILHAFNLAYGITGAMSVVLRGCWPYPFLDMLSKGEILLFYAYIHITSTLGLWLQNRLVNNIRGKGTQGGPPKPSLKKKIL
ncbi:androgen-dependent TFPI-regulating protein-like [Hetaerina americana]|uniref:androgen-dependent TFPI-regulating protein-like n=1 Tax=Hetaerina americana TaxID=62018 RepID=UPI003A7F61F3